MIFEIYRKEEWQSILADIGIYDCYHTFDYHSVAKQPNETPILIVYKSPSLLVALPLLIRPIENSDYFDCTSVYGYAGPIFTPSINNEEYQNFHHELKKFLLKKNVVSIFSRLNPFIPDQEKIISGIGKIEELGDVVYIDLLKEVEKQRQDFSKTTKRYINKARKSCYTKISSSTKDIEIFKELYFENMNRVGAKPFYYFNDQYFNEIIKSTNYTCYLIHAMLKDSDEVIASAMMISCNRTVHYHISGTKSNYLHLTPIRLILDEMRLIANEADHTYFNLGGGLGSEKDSLFDFKSSFSKDFRKFKVWKYIVDEPAYTDLSKKHTVLNTKFFPTYRSESDIEKKY